MDSPAAAAEGRPYNVEAAGSMSGEARDWYFREGGAVTSAAWAVADPAPMLRGNAYAKTWRGERLSPEESEALATAEGPATANLAGQVEGDMLLGMIAHHRPDILERLDGLAAELAGLGLLPVVAWNVLADYADRARQVVTDELAAEHLAGLPDDPEEAARQVAEAEAWEASEEGRRARAAMAPDDGPEGWSTVPPANPDHPCHPSKRTGGA